MNINVDQLNRFLRYISGRGFCLAAALAVLVIGIAGCHHHSAEEPGRLQGVESAVEPRRVVNLNAGWKFIRQDVPGAEQLSFNDSAWQAVHLPHTWNALDGEDGGNDYYRGPAWYRRSLILNDREKDKSLFLRFDAASSDAKVYVNGQFVGEHKGMFSAFCFEITPLIHPDTTNIIAVRVTNEPNPDIPPLSADFTFFGGLYRGVSLLALDPLSISPVDDASPGVYAKQTNVSADHADLEITTKLRNGAAAPATAAVTCDLMDADGHAVQSVTANQSLGASASGDIVQTMSLDHPHLWDGRKDPYLYHIRVSVARDGDVVDRVVQPVGIRFFKVDPDNGFYLNGRSYPLHGVNRHQDRLDMGWAINFPQQKQDFDLIMEMGCTAIRLAHYQHAQPFYDLCDHGGLVVWAEACLVNYVSLSPGFDDTCKQQLRELIKQSYNHPSICFWSLFNELRDKREKGQSEEDARQHLDHQQQLITALNAEAHQLDSTRLTTAASFADDPRYPLNLITDVIAINRYFGWYSKSNAAWPSELDRLHQQLPGRGVGISEYGAGASVYQHQLVFLPLNDPKQPQTTGNWHPEEWQSITHEQAYAAMKDRPWLWGTFLWNMFDFAVDSRREGDHLGRNDKGLVTYDRKIKKDAFFFYKANWSDQPVIYITSRRYTPRNVGRGPVKVYSNCQSVSLELNGVSLGTVPEKNCVFVWPDVTLQRGSNLLVARGQRNGKTYEDKIKIDYGVLNYRGFPATQPSTMP